MRDIFAQPSSVFRGETQITRFGKPSHSNSSTKSCEVCRFHPFMLLEVTPLMAHPSEAAYKQKYGEIPAMRGVNDP
jgi:hypothetical protein